MSRTGNTTKITLNITGVPDNDFLVLSFKGEEAISKLYSITIKVVAEREPREFEKLLHKEAFLCFGKEGEGLHGHIYSIKKGKTGTRLTSYTLVLKPFLAYLQHASNRRIFQNQTTTQIISQVLKEHGLLEGLHVEFQMGPVPQAERDYCVQYEESDLHFVQRLCEEDGRWFFFEHSEKGHRLIFGDDETFFHKNPPVILPYVPINGMAQETEALDDFGVRVVARTSEVVERDYDFQKSHIQLEALEKSDLFPRLQDYVYPGRFTEQPLGNQRAGRGLERHRTDYELAEGSTDQPLLRSGSVLKVEGHTDPDWNAQWVLISVEHEAYQPQVLEEFNSTAGMDEDGIQQGYRNRFTAIPERVQFRPPLEHPISRILGNQTARVTGPEGEEIYCDAYGRIRIKFHWDRSGKNDEFTSCWVRVASALAGGGYGAVSIPRVGMEAVVTFLEGDPAQPLVMGCVANNQNPVPYPLPENKTKSVFRSKSSRASTGYNELSLEDRAGSEKIYVRAQRDMEQNIQNDSRLEVGNERFETIKGKSTSVLEAEEDRTVTGARSVQLMDSDNLQVAADSHTRIGGLYATEVGGNATLKVVGDLVFESTSSITLKIPGLHIVIGPEGIFSSTLILPGGLPRTGTTAIPLTPGAAAALLPPPELPPVMGVIQSALMAQNQAMAADFCPLCEACREGLCTLEGAAA